MESISIQNPDCLWLITHGIEENSNKGCRLNESQKNHAKMLCWSMTVNVDCGQVYLSLASALCLWQVHLSSDTWEICLLHFSRIKVKWITFSEFFGCDYNRLADYQVSNENPMELSAEVKLLNKLKRDCESLDTEPSDEILAGIKDNEDNVQDFLIQV